MVLGLGENLTYVKFFSQNKKCVNNNIENTNENNAINKNNEQSIDNNENENNVTASNECNNKTSNYALSATEGRCLYEMLPRLESLFVSTWQYDKNTQTTYFDFSKYDAKDEQLIKTTLQRYLKAAGFGGNVLENGKYVGNFSITVSKTDLDLITNEVFNINGLNDYTSCGSNGLGLCKINDDFYKLSWVAKGGDVVSLYDISFNYDDNKMYITTSARIGSDSGDHGSMGIAKVTVNLNKNNGNCYIEKIEKIG